METTIEQPNAPISPTNANHLDKPPANAPAPARTRMILVIAFIVLAILAIFLVLGIVYRRSNSNELKSAASLAAITPPTVYVVHPVPAVAADLSLPGTTQAIEDAIVYARVSGYLRKRYVDLGDRVNAGQLLAEIESPELDQQLSQARANLEQANKQLDLQKANLELGADNPGALPDGGQRRFGRPGRSRSSGRLIRRGQGLGGRRAGDRRCQSGRRGAI